MLSTLPQQVAAQAVDAELGRHSRDWHRIPGPVAKQYRAGALAEAAAVHSLAPRRRHHAWLFVPLNPLDKLLGRVKLRGRRLHRRFRLTHDDMVIL